MADIFTKEKRSEIMSKIKGKNTGIEISFRRALWKAGLRGWRIHWGKYRIDVAFTKKKIAIFIDGCFWHGCLEHYKKPKSNGKYWLPKIEANKERDQRTIETLEREGWTVVRIWEHDLGKNEDIVKQITNIEVIALWLELFDNRRNSLYSRILKG